jgi:hypothetical protein
MFLASTSLTNCSTPGTNFSRSVIQLAGLVALRLDPQSVTAYSASGINVLTSWMTLVISLASASLMSDSIPGTIFSIS